MLYQLPTGETIDIPLEEYLAVSDESFDRYIRSGKYSSKFSIQLNHDEYSPDGTPNREIFEEYHDENEIELYDNRTLNQIINDMPEDNPE